MAWQIGIDEAGYGPNLGPLVLTAAAVRVPCLSHSIAKSLRKAIRRASDEDDGRLLIDDSKQVYVGPDGLGKLERGVLALFFPQPQESLTVGGYLSRIGAGSSHEDLSAEPWYSPDDLLPLAIEPDEWDNHASRVAKACQRSAIEWGPARSIVMPTPRFNALLDYWSLKSDVEASAVIHLMQEARRLPGSEPIHFCIDRLGGRTHYAAIIQTAFPDGWVIAHEEKAHSCRYSVIGLEREIHLCFEPKADGNHLPVAAASMACKYLREVCMRQFNRFWQARVSGLEPTAGYPGDAERFYRTIKAAMQELGLAPDHVWRRK
jgi:ribonuclease HII